jgi:hypothetical protein
MAFIKPTINTIKADIKNISIYLRSVKKFGKSTLFRDVILSKYNDPSRGLLVEVGMEKGATLLDNVNTTHVDSYKDLIELKKWLIEEKGKEHNIEIVAYDVADELVPLFDKETIRQHNLENPQKPTKSIKAAMGGYTAGEQYSATLMKNYFDEIKSSGIQVWVLGHSKYKNIKDKANVDNEGYMQLSSNLSAAYEAALGDIFDVVLTGVIDRNIETVGEGNDAKRYATDAIRKLYFRGTPEIDAGGRFAAGSVPEYLIFDKPNMAEDFIKTVEEGMEKSKTNFAEKKSTPKKKVESKPAPVVEEEDDLSEIGGDDIDEAPFDLDEDIGGEPEPAPIKLDKARLDAIRAAFRGADDNTKKSIKKILTNYGNKLAEEMYEADVISIETILQI